MDELVCVHCRSLLAKPVLLHCLHTCCYECAKSLVEESCIQCTSCRLVTVLDKSGVDGLPENTILERLVELANERTALCANCQDVRSAVRYYCYSCEARICQDCYNHTHGARMFKSHHIVPVEERRRELQNATKPASENQQTIAKEYRERLSGSIRGLEDRKTSMKTAVDDLNKELDSMNSTFDKGALQIMLHFQKLHQELENRENKLLSSARNILSMKADRLQAQRDALHSLVQESEAGISMGTLALQHGGDIEILELVPLIDKRVRGMATTDIPFQPCEQCELTYTFDEQLLHKIALHGRVEVGGEPLDTAMEGLMQDSSRPVSTARHASSVDQSGGSSSGPNTAGVAKLQATKSNSHYKCISWGNVNDYVHVQREGNQSLAAWLTKLRDFQNTQSSASKSQAKRTPHGVSPSLRAHNSSSNNNSNIFVTPTKSSATPIKAWTDIGDNAEEETHTNDVDAANKGNAVFFTPTSSNITLGNPLSHAGVRTLSSISKMQHKRPMTPRT